MMTAAGRSNPLLFSLVEPDTAYQTGFDAFFDNYKQSGGKMVPFTLKFYTGSFVDYVALLRGFPKGIGVPEGYIEHSTFWLKDDSDLILGTVNIRHRLNDSLRMEGGHIGYGVASPYRNRGCATRMLELALEKAKGLGIADVLITCDKDNAASARVALKNGGVLDSEELHNGRLIQRYWIKTQPS